MTKQDTKNIGVVGEEKVSPWAEQLVKAALLHAPKDGSIEVKAEFLQALVGKLKSVVEFEKWGLLTLESWVSKSWYREVAKLEGHIFAVQCLQALPDGRIVSGSRDGTLRCWTRTADATWHGEVLPAHELSVECLQALPDGRIVSGGHDKTICVWTRGPDGKWIRAVLSGHTGPVSCLKALPGEKIVSGGGEGLSIWTRGSGGEWSSEVLSGQTLWLS